MTATEEPRRLGLEIRFDAEPIRGRLYDHDDRLDRPFSGWLGLMAAIEAAASAPGAEGRSAMREHVAGGALPSPRTAQDRDQEGLR